MFYDQLGRLRDRYPEKQGVSVKLRMNGGKQPTLSVSPRIIGGYQEHQYELLVGRGRNHFGWIGFWFKPPRKHIKKIHGKFDDKPYWCSTQLKLYYCMKDGVYENLLYVITKEILYVQLPTRQGLQERDDWWLGLPDVSDNPQDKRAEIRDMHTMRGDGGTPE